jgi:hypothetical protein
LERKQLQLPWQNLLAFSVLLKPKPKELQLFT